MLDHSFLEGNWLFAGVILILISHVALSTGGRQRNDLSGLLKIDKMVAI